MRVVAGIRASTHVYWCWVEYQIVFLLSHPVDNNLATPLELETTKVQMRSEKTCSPQFTLHLIVWHIAL